MGMFLHELIPLDFAARYPGIWRREQTANEKDLVYIPDADLSVEIKTSRTCRRRPLRLLPFAKVTLAWATTFACG